MQEGYRGTPMSCIEWLSRQKDGLFEVKPYKETEKRSLSANAYLWVLVNKLAEKMSPPIPKEEMYQNLIKDYAPCEYVSVLSSIDVKGFFKYYEARGTGTVQGRKFTHYLVWKGSSEFNKKEMSKFLDGVIEECRLQDIETITPEEKERMIQQIGEKV